MIATGIFGKLQNKHPAKIKFYSSVPVQLITHKLAHSYKKWEVGTMRWDQNSACDNMVQK